MRLASGGEIEGRAVVLTTGTFLAAVLHTGESTTDGGRVGEAPATGLSEDLRALGLRLGRFKTGTPPRLWARSIDFERTVPQPGDECPRALSFWNNGGAFPRLPQRECWVTHSTPETHEVVRRSLHRSPLYAGRISGTGPRYCPSFEDKVVRFAGREQHTVFLEPEGLDSPLVYPGGLSNSLPPEVQEAFLRTIPGLEAVELAQPGYAVEYDYVPATQLDRRLAVGETGLFLAGQINGTSGYEEAAVQGFWAGVNAARWVAGEPAWGLSPRQAHLAVLIDELVGRELGGQPPGSLRARPHLSNAAQVRRQAAALLLRRGKVPRRRGEIPRGLPAQLVHHRAQPLEQVQVLSGPVDGPARDVVGDITDCLLCRAHVGARALQTHRHRPQLLRRREPGERLVASRGACGQRQVDLVEVQPGTVQVGVHYD